MSSKRVIVIRIPILVKAVYDGVPCGSSETAFQDIAAGRDPFIGVLIRDGNGMRA